MKWLRNWIKEEIRSQFSIAYSESVVEELKGRIRALEYHQRETDQVAEHIAQVTIRKIVEPEKFLDDIVQRIQRKQL